MPTDINRFAIHYAANEDFEAGRQALQPYITTGFAWDDSLDLTALATQLHSDAQKVAAYWFTYFTARLKIEHSYDFIFATQLFEWGLAQLQGIQEASNWPSRCALIQAKIAVYSVDIDRGLHNNDFTASQQACEKLQSLITLAPECASNMTTEHYYINAMHALSKLLAQKEAGYAPSQQDWQQLKATLHSAVEQAQGSKIYASMLKAHWFSLPALEAAPQHKLRILEGQLVSTYYATLNSIEVDNLISSLQNETRRNALIKALDAEAFFEPEPPDILSDLSTEHPFRIWQFSLTALELPYFRGQGLTYELHLRINSLGLLQLNFTSSLAGADVNDLRQRTNLALQNALDETLSWPVSFAPTSNLRYLSQVAQTVFAQVAAWLGQSNSLMFAVGEHVHNTVLIETAVCTSAPQQWLNLAALQAHPDWQGITIPPREVRSVFESWRVQSSYQAPDNIAADLYHQHDWVQADGSYALIVQCDQPSWVTEQALENVLVATAARFYMRQLGTLLFANVRSIQQAYHDDDELDGKSRYELKQQEKIYRKRVKQLHLLNLQVRELLHLMDSGGLMRFPDHGRFMQRLFTAVGVDEERLALQKTMRESQETTRFLRLQIATALEQIQQRSSQRFDTVIGFMGVLLSVTALSDLFGIVEETGFIIPAITKVEIVVGLMALIILYFSIEAIIRRFK